MKLIDDIREKIGDDKLLHFLIYALVVAAGCLASIQIGILAFYAMLALSLVKELLDDFFNWKDFFAGILGGLFSLLIKLLIIVL